VALTFNGTTQGGLVEVLGRVADAVQSMTPSNQGVDTVTSSVSHTLGNWVENLTLAGGAGAINGTGNALANIIVGNESNNRLTGAAGADVLTGGTGADTFVFNQSSHGGDQITDFVSGIDKLEINAAGFGGGLTSGGAVDLVFASTAAAASHAGSGGYFIYDSTGLVSWDATGGSGADAVAITRLQTGASLTAADFLIT